MCHLVLIAPFVSLILFVFMPFDQALLLYSLILLSCAILYWLIWKAMRRPVSTGIEGMIGGVGQVIRNESGTTKVFFRGEIWDAISADELSADDSVEIIGLKRMQLMVRRRIKSQDHAKCCSGGLPRWFS